MQWLLWMPAAALGLVAVPIMLLFGWNGFTTMFGNAKYGKHGNDAEPARNFFQSWRFLARRNPISNMGHGLLANWVNTDKPTEIWGFTGVTDGPAKIRGWYFILHPEDIWEYRFVWPTFPGRCLEVRIGWKLNGLVGEDDYYKLATFVCRYNPFRKFG